jgi:hypothetical protein
MVKAVDNGAASAALPLTNYPTVNMVDASLHITELVATAFARLSRDLETYHPTKPAIAYALAEETHAVTLQRWRQYPPAAQTALLTALLEEASELLRQLQARIARIAPTNGYMYGLQDEAIKLEAQADVALEEIHRIEADLSALEAGGALQ